MLALGPPWLHYWRTGLCSVKRRLANMKFIFEVRMKPGYTVDEYADAWVRAIQII
jgi:hypothetical protein